MDLCLSIINTFISLIHLLEHVSLKQITQEAGGSAGRTEAPVSEGQQQPGETPPTPNATITLPEAGGGGAGRTESLP
jgi:hypothetical protein